MSDHVADRLEILNVLARYAHAYDAGDEAALADIFSQDALFRMFGSVGHVPAQMTGRQAIIDGLVGKREWVKPAQRRHYGTNVHVAEQTGTTARASSYLLLCETRDGVVSTLATGRYEDQLVKEDDGRWRISVRDAYPDSPVP